MSRTDERTATEPDEGNTPPLVNDLGRLRDELDERGCAVVPTGIETELLGRVVADIFQHTHTTPDRPESWYRPHIIWAEAGTVEMFHYQSMWDVRQHPRLYEIFRALHRCDRLWVSLDRIAMKPPVSADHPEFDTSGFIHWDTDINAYPEIPFQVQGVLALADTDLDMGGFQCVPLVYRQLAEFVRDYPTRPIPSTPELDGHEVVRVALRAGEIAIWKTTMLHGNSRNCSTRLRLAQYVTMNPEPAGEAARAEKLASRIASWAANETPPGKSFPGDARRIEQQRGEPARLTVLGERLLGSKQWE